MGVYTRFKRNPDGLRQLVELLESTPGPRRQKMIDIGMQEDPDYTNQALSYLLNFGDVEKLPDNELAEVVSQAPARITAYAFHASNEETKARVLRCAQPRIAAEVKDLLTATVKPSEMGGAQIKLIEITRKLEKRGAVKTKRIVQAA